MLALRAFAVLALLSTVLLIEYDFLPLNKKRIDVNGNAHFQQKGDLLVYKNEPFTGIAIERFPKGNIYRSTEYLMGTKHGVMEEYGFTGDIKYRWNYVNGQKEGAQYEWYLEGPRKYIKHYKAGLLQGLSTEWFINGHEFRVQNFNQGKEISSKVYYSTSELHTNYVKRDGAIYGLKTGELCMDFKKDGEIR